MKQIKMAQVEIDAKRFKELMSEYCPDIPSHTSFFGTTYGETYWQGYSEAGTWPLLVSRMNQKNQELIDLLRKEMQRNQEKKD